jgi:hypothetical protein
MIAVGVCGAAGAVDPKAPVNRVRMTSGTGE